MAQPRTYLASLLFASVLMCITGLLYHYRSPYLPAHWVGIGSAAMIISALNFELGAYPFDPWTDGAPSLAIGVIAFGLAVYHDRFAPVKRWGAEIEQASLRLTWMCLIPGLAGIGLLAEISGQFLESEALEWSLHAQFALMVVAFVLFWCGVAGIRWSDVRALHLPRITWTRVALLVITGLGLLLRTWQLETAIHQFIDEMNFGRAVWGIKQPDAPHVALMAPFSGVAAFPFLYPYWQGIGIDIFGWNLTALRSVSVVFGTLTIPAVYLLVKYLFDDRHLALVSALLLAALPPHIHFSRIGINNIADPLIGVLMMAFLARGLRHQQQRDFATAGIMLGLTQYFYEGGRIVYPLLAVTWILALVMLRRFRMNRAALYRVVLFLIVGIIIALPVYYTLYALERPVFARFETAGVGGSYWQTMQEFDREQTLEDHVLRPLLIYVRNPDLSEFYGGNTPILLVFVVPAFLMGLAYGLWRLRYPSVLLLLMWMAAVSVGGMFLAESGHTARFVVAFPAAVVLIALGLWYATLRNAVLMVIIAAGFAIYQADYYFNTHIPYYNDQRRQFPDFQDALFRVVDLPDGSEACFVTSLPLDRTTISNIRDFLSPELDICYVDPDVLTPTFLDGTQTRNTPLALMVEPQAEDAMQTILQYYGDRVEGPLLSPYEGVPLRTQYRIYIFRP